MQTAQQQVSIIKFGGSSLDDGVARMRAVAKEIELLSRKRPLILTVGGGEVLSICLRKLRKQQAYERDPNALNLLTFHALNFNCHLLRKMLGTNRAQVIESGNKREIEMSLSGGNLPIVPRIDATSFKSWPWNPFPNQSDLATGIIAEEFNAEKVIFVKNLPGICSRDPNLRESQKKNFITLEEPVDISKEKQDINIYVYRKIRSNQVLHVVSKDHCIEKRCLDFMQGSKNVKTIYYTGVSQPKNLEALFQGKNVGTKLYVG